MTVSNKLVSAALCIVIAQTALAGHPQFERHDFKLPQEICSVAAIDLNLDDQLDLIAIGTTQVYGLISPDWKTKLLGDYPGGRFSHAIVIDCDQDGDDDLAVARTTSDWVRYRQALIKGEKPPRPTGVDFSIGWLEVDGSIENPLRFRTIDTQFDHVFGMTSGDIDQDGMPDLVAGSYAGPFENSIAFYPGHQRQVGNTRSIVSRGLAKGRLHHLNVADLIAGDELEVIAAASATGTIHCWKRDDKSGLWDSHLIAANLPGATHPVTGDIDGDGRLDIAISCGHGQGVYWFRGPDWERHPIDESIEQGHAFSGRDMDNDGDLDFVLGSSETGTLVWYENNENEQFSRREIDTDTNQPYEDLKLIDINEDGKIDILIGGGTRKNLVWYQQLNPSK